MPETDSAPGFLGRLNNSLTAVSAIVGTLGAIAAGTAAMMANFAKNEATGAKEEATEAKTATQLALKQQTEQPTYNYVQFFLDRISKDKLPEMTTAALDIIAQASEDEEGKVAPEIKRALPIRLALISEQPGGIAGMDPDLAYAKGWVSAARWHASNKIRLTAIQALSHICRDAVAAQNLEVAQQAVDEAFQLRKRTEEIVRRGGAYDLPTDETETPDRQALRREYREMLTELADLYSVLTRAGWPTVAAEDNTAPEDSRAKRMLLLADAVGEIKRLDRGVAETLTASTQTNPTSQETENNAVVTRIVQQAVEDFDKQRTIPDGSGPNVARIRELIEQLRSEVQEVRRGARVELALIGQPAVAAMMAELKARSGANLARRTSLGDYKTKLGIAVALSRMKQPVEIRQPEDMGQVVALIRAGDAETRVSAADFLMNLEDPDTIRVAFNEINKLVPGKLNPKEDGHAMMNSAVVMGTWARTMNDTVMVGTPEKSLRSEALAVARHWLEELKRSPQKADWTKTISTLNSLITRAESPP